MREDLPDVYHTKAKTQFCIRRMSSRRQWASIWQIYEFIKRSITEKKPPKRKEGEKNLHVKKHYKVLRTSEKMSLNLLPKQMPSCFHLSSVMPDYQGNTDKGNFRHVFSLYVHRQKLWQFDDKFSGFIVCNKQCMYLPSRMASSSLQNFRLSWW